MAQAILEVDVEVSELSRDLGAVQAGFGREVTQGIRGGGQPLVAAAMGLVPLGPGPQGPGDSLPHIRDTLALSDVRGGLSIGSDHPGAPVLHWGGTIAPRGHPIHFNPTLFAVKAAEAGIPAVEQRVEASVDALLKRHGL